MAINDPVWSYGDCKLITSSGATISDGDDVWSYGVDIIRHEFAAPPVGRTTKNTDPWNLGQRHGESFRMVT